MLRGFLLGVSWGGLVATIAVTSVSLVYSNANRAPVTEATQEVVSGPKPAVPAVATPEAPAQVPTEPQPAEAAPSLPTADAAQVATETPAAPAMGENDAPPTENDAGNDAETGQTPEVMVMDQTNGEDVLTANQEGTQTMGADDAPVSPAASSVQPAVPQPETLPEAQPESSAQTDVIPAPAIQVTPAEGDAAQAETQTDVPDAQGTALPQVLALDPSQTLQQDAILEMPSPDDSPGIQTPNETAPEPAAPASEGQTDGQFETARVSVPKITNLAPNVRTNRLPTIGGNTEAEVVEVGQEATAKADKRALTAHAMAFENPDAKPMFSVVLIDDPQHPVSDDVLSHLPFALSFAVDAVRDDAYAVAARYRAAGFEVLMLTNLPFGANATDVEVAFGAYARAIPEAIGVLDLGANGFLRGPSTATQIAGIMSEKGYGLITPSKGLNSAQKAAMREGVPAALVYRELDADAEKPSVIRRYLDRAAFRAAQEGSVIMLGHTRADTIEALVTWALEDRAASVIIAPVSAVLLGQ